MWAADLKVEPLLKQKLDTDLRLTTNPEKARIKLVKLTEMTNFICIARNLI